jgi:CRP-like cAMP-binding protein
MIDKLYYQGDIENNIKNDLNNVHFTDELQLKKFLIKNADIITRLKFRKKENIIKEGDSGDYIFFVADGFMKLFIERNNKKLFIKILKPGDFMGLALLSDLEQYPYSLVSVSDTTVYLIDKESFKEKAYDNSFLMKASLNLLSDLLNSLYSKLISFRFKQMNGRIADALLYFSDEIFNNQIFDMPINMKQLGEFTNVSQENVSRVIKSFIEEKIITKNNKKIKILDKYKLVHLSRNG